MANFGPEIMRMALAAKPQARQVGARNININAREHKDRGGDIGQAWGAGIGEGFRQMYDPDMQRERALQARDVLLSIPEQQRHAIIKRPDVQNKLKEYSRYMPELFHDAAEVSKNPNDAGFLTVADDMYLEQRLSGAKAKTEESLARGADIRQDTSLKEKLEPGEVKQQKQDLDKGEQEINVLKKRIDQIESEIKLRGKQGQKIDAEKRSIDQATDEARSLEQETKANLEADTQEKQSRAGYYDSYSSYLDAQRDQIQDETLSDLDEIARKAFSEQVKQSATAMQQDVRDLMERVKFKPAPEKTVAMEYTKMARGFLTGLGTTTSIMGGAELSGVPYIVTDPNALRIADRALKESYKAVKHRRSHFSGDELRELTDDVNVIMDASFKHVKDYAGRVDKDISKIAGQGHAWAIWTYVNYVTHGGTWDPKDRQIAEQTLKAWGMLDPIGEAEEVRRGWNLTP